MVYRVGLQDSPQQIATTDSSMVLELSFLAIHQWQEEWWE